VIKVVTPKIKKSGGPGIFMDRLLRYMQDHEMVRIVKKGDLYFATVWLGSPPKGHRSVYRAASAYYDSNQKKRHGLNKKIAKAIKSAYHVVYQTKFARRLCQKVLKSKAKRYSIIHNGFDATEYNNINPLQLGNKTFVACSGWNNDAKRGNTIIKAFNRAQLPGCRLIMLGGGLDKKKFDNVKKVGKMGIESIVKYLKSRPIFVHLCYADVCPNVVVEALSFGCPVVCNNIGGAPELVKEDGIVAACDRPFVFKRRPVNYKVADLSSISNAMQAASEIKWNVDRPDLSMKECAKQYYDVFEGVLQC